MSHKFHGKGSGKKKIEKRLKKIQEEEFLKKSSSIDTPLNTLAMLKSKQAAAQSPYILLKGAGAQSLQAWVCTMCAWCLHTVFHLTLSTSSV